MVSLEYLVVPKNSTKPLETLNGIVVPYKSDLDLRNFADNDIYFRSLDRLELDAVIFSDMPVIATPVEIVSDSARGGGSSVDRELVVTTYNVKNAFIEVVKYQTQINYLDKEDFTYLVKEFNLYFHKYGLD
jgi:hypothetical protein